jgi:CRISPR/Cas system CMR subunit Cmr6 (Cas7 group RAMP superfamily)
MRTGQEQTRAETKASQMEMSVIQEKMETVLKNGQEEMKVMTSSIQPELEETIKQRVEDNLSSVDQWTQGLRKELKEKIEQTQLGLQTSFDMRTRDLREEIANGKGSNSGP